MGRHIEDGGIAARAIALLEKKGALRTAAIAEALGVDAKTIASSLWHHVQSGRLVTCKVEVPGSSYPSQNEYRISAGMPANKLERDMAEKRARANGLVVPAGPIRRTPPAGILSVPTHTPVQPTSHSARSTAPKSERAPAFPREPEPTTEPQEAMTMSADTKPFRCAMASDGGLFLFPAGAGPVELSPQDTRTLVDYLRRLADLAGPAADSAPAIGRLPALLERQVS